jgi:uncharacterized protein (DUF952 family)
VILHLALKPEWDAAQATGIYRVESLATQGYIHCSTELQAQRTANKYYKGVRDALLLEVDPAKLAAPLRFEPAGSWLTENPGRPHSEYSGDLYPHIYGPINIESVVRVIPYLPDADGTFSAPPL